MSYCRWSTDINNTMSMEEMLQLYKEHKGYSYCRDLMEERGAEWSEWYVFDNVNELCSVWHKGSDPIDYAYEDLNDIVETHSYESITGYNECNEKQQEFIRDVLDDVIAEWKEEQDAL